MRRRDLLASGAAAAGLGLLPRSARAAWGEAPATSTLDLLAPGDRAERCLELFLYGGMATFESFYVVPEYGTSDNPDPALRNSQWHLFSGDHANTFNACNFGPSSDWLTPFASDSLGYEVNLGPLTTAFKSRPDLLARLRVVVIRHDFEPHEAAIPYMMTGLRLGNPRMSGLGAHIQRYWKDRDTTGRVIPWSYVFSPVANDQYNTHTAAAVGLQPGSARPLKLTASASMDLASLIGRLNIDDDDTRLNAYLTHLADQELARYVDPTSGSPLRSRVLADHDFAMRSLVNARSLQEVLSGDLFAVGDGTACGAAGQDVSAMSLRAGVSLLTHPTAPARYVNVIDGGFPFYGGLAYDTHSAHLDTHARTLHHLLKTLAERINEPAEGDPTKLDLDDTLILINAEFGRSPTAQSSGGTNHFPHGMVAVMIGGPVQPGITGAIGPDGYAVEYLNPSEYRAGALAALGIYPFSVESFAVGDLQSASDEQSGLQFLNETVLGRAP